MKNNLFPLTHSALQGIPWAMIAPCEAAAQRNHNQSLARLAQRGGLSPAEAYCVLKDLEPLAALDVSDKDAEIYLCGAIDRWLVKNNAFPLATKALQDTIDWHETQDKALSKQSPSVDSRWRRNQHREQIELIREALDALNRAAAGLPVDAPSI
jgi:hypothetical protein